MRRLKHALWLFFFFFLLKMYVMLHANNLVFFTNE